MESHIPVLLNECIEGLSIKPNGIYVDATLGMGGHSEEILKRLSDGKLVSIDRDQTAIEKSAERLSKYGEKSILVHGNYSSIAEILNQQGIDKIDGILFDFGVSSPQLDEAQRGFSYTKDAALDMRMDRSYSMDAWFVVNKWPEEKIYRILRDYGEEKYSSRIAKAIIKYREEKEIKTTLELADIIRTAMPAKALREKQHPAKRSFQAIRIAVNDELGHIEEAMAKAPYCLNKGGRLVVISFHSLEDRIVKNSIAELENGCKCPREAPICICGFEKVLKSVNRKPILPTQTEQELNPRARSAKLRIAERV